MEPKVDRHTVKMLRKATYWQVSNMITKSIPSELTELTFVTGRLGSAFHRLQIMRIGTQDSPLCVLNNNVESYVVI